VRLLALGVDHRTAPTAVREALAFEGARLDEGLDALRTAVPGVEAVILSTCNRVELYVATGDDDARPEVEDLAAWLAGFHGVPAATLAGHLVAHHDEAVVGHLFRVAASLESLVLGEGQILGQVRDAYRAAAARGAVGPILHGLFQRALRVGKLVRERTGMDQGRLSIASVAVDLARDVFDSFGDKTVLVVGAGKMADLTLQHLSTLKPGRVLITNRSFDRACEAAGRRGAQAVPFDRLDDALTEADVVISTTAAERPIVEHARYAELQRRRRGGRLALILDIAVPRDFDPRIGDLDQVLLYNVDDLRAQVEQNLRRRRAQIEPAQELIERETTAFLAELRHQRHAGALLRQLGDYGDAIAARELSRFLAACPDLSDAQRQAAEHLVHRLKNQFLHHPRAALRTAADAPPDTAAPHPLLAAVRHLFGLGDGHGKAHPPDAVESR
jgi:glutamyl-tRNA reductase